MAPAQQAGVKAGLSEKTPEPMPIAEVAATPIASPIVLTPTDTLSAAAPPVTPAATPSPTAATAPPPASATPPSAAAGAEPTPAATATPGAVEPTPVPATPAPEAKAAPEKPFSQLIASASSSRSPAYVRLLELWGVAPQGAVGDECSYAKKMGLRCLSLRTNWKELQTLDRPAVMELVQPGGSRRYAALTGIEGERAVIDLNGQTYRTPMADLQPYWRGDAVILWKPPFDKASIGLRERGETVRWIRERLAAPAAPGLELVFDEGLKAKVVAFQRQKGLLADGRAGALTLLHLQLLADSPDAPKLGASSKVRPADVNTP